jgi:hypothetical protein
MIMTAGRIGALLVSGMMVTPKPNYLISKEFELWQKE